LVADAPAAAAAAAAAAPDVDDAGFASAAASSAFFAAAAAAVTGGGSAGCGGGADDNGASAASSSAGSGGASLALAEVTPMTAAGIKLGLWRMSGYDQSEYVIIVSEIEGSPDAFRTVMYINGASASETGLTYYCSRSDGAGGLKATANSRANSIANASATSIGQTCKASQNPEFLIQIKNDQQIILKNRQVPMGLEMQFVGP
jgi:hypothetical protein